MHACRAPCALCPRDLTQDSTMCPGRGCGHKCVHKCVWTEVRVMSKTGLMGVRGDEQGWIFAV